MLNTVPPSYSSEDGVSYSSEDGVSWSGLVDIVKCI